MPSKISNTITLRLKNEQIAVVDMIVELGEFKNRNDAIRAMLMPSFMQFVKVMETKSVAKGALAKVKGELQLKKHLDLVAKNTEIHDYLPLDIPGIQNEHIYKEA